MSQSFAARSLSISWWSNYNLCRCLCCLIVLALNTCQFVHGANNTPVSECWCNSTESGAGSLNATKNTCNCTKDTLNCRTGYQLLNGTCVKCFCNDTSNCNCSTSQKAQSTLTCLPGQFLANSSHGQNCESCNCSMLTSLNNTCNNRTGQCPCKEHLTGQNCTICATNYTGNFSSSGELLNCFKLCPKGFLRKRNECIKVNTTSASVSTKGPSLVMSSTNSAPVFTERMVSTLISSMAVLSSLSTGVPLSSLPPSQKIPSSTYFAPSPSITILQSTKNSSSIQTPLPTEKSPLLTVKSQSTTITLPSPTVMPPSPTVGSASLTIESPSLTVESLSLTVKPPSLTVKSLSPTITLPSPTVMLPPHTITPSTAKSPYPSSTEVPVTTGQPISTNIPIPTTDHLPTTGEQSTAKPSTETNKPPSEKPTTKFHHTSEKVSSNDRASDVLVIVLVCLGVVVILGIAIAIGCWCLRLKRKPSAPFWTVELSSTRNEDFALLDPVTDEPHKKTNDTSEADASITEHSRYYAYI